MDLVNPDRAGRTNGGKSKKMEHESTASSTLVGAALASLPSKFVVFSPNGEMEKGASASALALHHEMKLVGITIWLPGPELLYIVNPE